MHGPWMLRLMRENLNGRGRDGAGVVGGAVCPLEDELGGARGRGSSWAGLEQTSDKVTFSETQCIRRRGLHSCHNMTLIS